MQLSQAACRTPANQAKRAIGRFSENGWNFEKGGAHVCTALFLVLRPRVAAGKVLNMSKPKELPADVSPGGHENHTYQLMRRLRSGEFVGCAGSIDFGRCGRQMIRMIESTHRASDQIRCAVRRDLPADLSPALVPRAEAAVDQAVKALRKDLFDVFDDELDKVLVKERAREAAMYDCVRCGDGTKGRLQIAGIGYLCSQHLDSMKGGK